MYGLDLFSGIGGITIALRDWVTPVTYCEIDRYAQGVLLSRMSEGQLPMAPIWDDVATLRAEHLPIRPDIIYGGFPCQDISVAGRGIGLGGKRSGLFFEIARLVGEIRPRFVFLENVPAINLRGQEQVVSTLTELGYDCRWTVVSAAEVGANHLRERWFALAYRQCLGVQGQQLPHKQAPQIESSRRAVAPSNVNNNDWAWRTRRESFVEDGMVGVVHGISSNIHRIKGLGNAVVPLQVKVAFERLLMLA